MLVDAEPGVAGPITLAIDIGGSHLKAGLLAPTGAMIGAASRVDTPLPATPEAVMRDLLAMVGGLGKPDRVSAGFPGVVRSGVVLTAPNLGTAAWHGYALARRLQDTLDVPARVLNDASVQGLGVIGGRGLECVITLGTGMGFALFQDGRLTPHLELSRHPVSRGKIYDDYIGQHERTRIGDAKWNRRIVKVIGILRTLINFDTLLIGGGNAKYLQFDLPPDIRIVPNQAGITGGVRLWDPILDEAFNEPPPAFSAVVGPT